MVPFDGLPLSHIELTVGFCIHLRFASHTDRHAKWIWIFIDRLALGGKRWALCTSARPARNDLWVVVVVVNFCEFAEGLSFFLWMKCPVLEQCTFSLEKLPAGFLFAGIVSCVRWTFPDANKMPGCRVRGNWKERRHDDERWLRDSQSVSAGLCCLLSVVWPFIVQVWAF